MQATLKQISRKNKDTGKNERTATLQERLQKYMNYTDMTEECFAGKISYSPGLFEAYRQRDVKYSLEGDLKYDFSGIEKAIATFLDREERNGVPFVYTGFCLTDPAKQILGVFKCCHEDGDMGVVVAAAGSGKTETGRHYKRNHPDTLFRTADITTRAPGSTLLLISQGLPGVSRYDATSAVFMQRIIEHLSGSRRLLIIDEAHFLSWESIEAVRRIHDATGIGIVLMGQESLYQQMRGGRRSVLFDQILSRIGVRCHLRGDVTAADVSMLVNSILPGGVDRKALEFLLHKANSAGRFRIMVKLLKKTHRVAVAEKKEVTLELLREINQMLML
jgi:DNA transposition AAA+ family ATPase